MPLPNYNGEDLGWFQAGAGIGKAWVDRRLRIQEMQAEEAHRRIQERVLTQQLGDLQRKAAEDIQSKAELEKAAMAAVTEQNLPDFIFPPEGTQGPPAPNRAKPTLTDSLMRNMLPALAKHDPKSVAPFLKTVLNAEEDADINSQRNQRLAIAERNATTGEGNLYLREVGVGQRDTGLKQTAVSIAGNLKEHGLTPGISMVPAGVPSDQPLVVEAPRRLTQGAVTATQKVIRDADTALDAIRRAQASVTSTPEAFGPLGQVREALEVARSIINPGQPTPVTTARQTADVSAEQTITGLKQDSQMSLFEKRQYDKLARITGPFTTPDVAQAKLNVIAIGLESKKIRALKALGLTQPLTPEELSAAQTAQSFLDANADISEAVLKDDDELAEAIRGGFISAERGVAEYRRRHRGK